VYFDRRRTDNPVDVRNHMSTLLFGLLALPAYLLMLWPLVVASQRVLGVRIRTVRHCSGRWPVGSRSGRRLAVPELPRVTWPVRRAAHPDRRLCVSRNTDVPVSRRDGLPQRWRAGVCRAAAVDPTAGRPWAAVLAGQPDRGETRDRSLPGRSARRGWHPAGGAGSGAAAGAQGCRGSPS
jgi:hypothetical protein